MEAKIGLIRDCFFIPVSIKTLCASGEMNFFQIKFNSIHKATEAAPLAMGSDGKQVKLILRYLLI